MDLRPVGSDGEDGQREQILLVISKLYNTYPNRWTHQVQDTAVETEISQKNTHMGMLKGSQRHTEAHKRQQ